MEDENVEYTETYLEYKKQQEERIKARKLKQEKTKQMQHQTSLLEIRPVTLKDFPNYKKLLIISNIPFEVTNSEVEAFFYTLIAGTTQQSDAKQYPITNVRRLDKLGIVTLEFRKK